MKRILGMFIVFVLLVGCSSSSVKDKLIDSEYEIDDYSSGVSFSRHNSDYSFTAFYDDESMKSIYFIGGRDDKGNVDPSFAVCIYGCSSDNGSDAIEAYNKEMDRIGIEEDELIEYFEEYYK